MQPYLNLSGDSGVEAYEIGDTFIIVRFREGKERTYKYTYTSAGAEHVETMKRLAKAGRGLNSYIGLYVKQGYDSKW